MPRGTIVVAGRLEPLRVQRSVTARCPVPLASPLRGGRARLGGSLPSFYRATLLVCYSKRPELLLLLRALDLSAGNKRLDRLRDIVVKLLLVNLYLLEKVREILYVTRVIGRYTRGSNSGSWRLDKRDACSTGPLGRPNYCCLAG